MYWNVPSVANLSLEHLEHLKPYKGQLLSKVEPWVTVLACCHCMSTRAAGKYLLTE